jgi:hypothetical protein
MKVGNIFARVQRLVGAPADIDGWRGREHVLYFVQEQRHGAPSTHNRGAHFSPRDG